jgi:AcrR family transcriptional regulator
LTPIYNLDYSLILPEKTVKLRERQRLTTKSEIVGIAFELFAKQGYDEVSVEMIADAAGISRATFFNYFPTKDLILHELAAARAERVRQMFALHLTQAQSFTREDLMRMILEIARENARLSFNSKKLFLDAISHQISRGLLVTAREQAFGFLTEALTSFIRDKTSARLVAETLFCVLLGTMLDWLMREDLPEEWLAKAMQARVQLLLEAVP